MIIEEDVYLEHFGVKGMHWGVRKEPKRSLSPTAKLQKKRQFHNRVRKVARVGAAVGLAGISAVAVHSFIKHHQAIRMLQVSQLRTTRHNILAAQQYIDAHKVVKTSTFRKAWQVSPSGVATPIYRTVRRVHG